MQISWNGLSCFTITAQTGSGEVTLVTDPYHNETGLKLSRSMSADLVAVSHAGQDADNAEAVEGPSDRPGRAGKPFVIDIPGEYEVKGIFVQAVDAPRKEDKKPHRYFHIDIEGMSLLHLGALDRALTPKEMEALDDIDILFVPVGGGRYLDPKVAADVIGQIEPRIVVPYAYAVDGLKENLGTIDAFHKAMGGCKREDVSKLKIVRKNLPEDQMLMYVLNRD